MYIQTMFFFFQMSLFTSWLLIQGVAWTPGGVWDGRQQPQGLIREYMDGWAGVVWLQNS